jgi:aminoglycoside/choline kinase family phosphotransferase
VRWLHVTGSSGEDALLGAIAMPGCRCVQPPGQRGVLKQSHGERIRALIVSESLGRVTRLDEIPAGLGTRRFYRVHLANAAPLIARVEVAEDPNTATREPKLTPLLAHLAAAALPVPQVAAATEDESIVLLEDLGSASLEDAAQSESNARRFALYAEACALIPHLQRVAPPPPKHPNAQAIEAFSRHLDAELIATKADKFCGWSLPVLLERKITRGEQTCVTTAFAQVAAEVESAPARLSHRDFKAANLHLQKDRSGHETLRMIDLQGAFMAPPEYDLVCLLRDSHVPLPENEVRQHADTTRPQLPEAPHADVFWRRFDLLSLVRIAKDISHYLHAATSRDDTRYLPFIPTALANLKRAANQCAERDPVYAPIASLIADLPDGLLGQQGAAQ